MADAAIFYASISGRTRRTASAIADALRPLSVATYDLRESRPDDLDGHGLLVFGSPTYGTGDWHHLWGKWAGLLADRPAPLAGRPVGLFALGDVRHHRATFAGAILRLRDLVERLGATVAAPVPFDPTYDAAACRPLLADGVFPGLVLDQVNQRYLSAGRVTAWAERLKREGAATSEPSSRGGTMRQP